MKTEKVLKSGQPGTKKWVEKYGKDFVCLRHKVDEASNRRLLTIEIIVNEKPLNKRQNIPFNKSMQLKIGYDDLYLRKLVKSAGGKWDPDNKVWELSYGKIIELGLEKKMLVNK